jgi:hypothetical protein
MTRSTAARTHLAAACLLLLLTLAAGYRLAFSGWIMARGDTYSYHYPYWDARAAALRDGHLPLWTPDLFAGAPLLANPQTALLYPPNLTLIGLDAPDAVRVSALLHLWWAGLGAYALARRALGVGWLAGCIGGAAFLLGGHIGAHVEQINQLQGLAWLPWALWALEVALTGRGAAAVRGGALLAAIMALQVFSGHTQTVFLTGAALAISALLIRPVRGALVLALSGVGAVLLALPQLVPTLELSSVSNRSGGFNPDQATAFSFSPFATGRGLLPSFDRMIFSEYIAYPGIIAGALAWVGVISRPDGDPSSAGRLRRALAHPAARWTILALIGLFLAYGLYNPVYMTLAGLPGFNLFRVPARWLALFAIGVAMLAALGAHALLHRRAPRPIALLPYAALIGGLMAASTLITRTLDGTPAYPAETITWIGWIAALGIALVGVVLARGRRGVFLLGAALCLELGLAAGALAYNQLVPPDAWSAARFTLSQMRVYRDDADPHQNDRLLSMSDLLFDPGDRAALERRYDALGITGEARALAFDTIKLREIAAPNLSLAWGIPTLDGFDGGLLPTRWYTAFSALLLPDGALRSVDGRLREALYADSCGGACLPDSRWLNLTGTRWLLTDKVYDLVRAGVFFDTTFDHADSAFYRNHTGFSARAVEVLYACHIDLCLPPQIDADDTSLSMDGETERLDRYQWVRYRLDAPVVLEAITITPQAGTSVRAVTLVDDSSPGALTFAQLAPAPYRRILSSDIKLYENPDAFPRAWLVDRARCVDADFFGDEAALTLMRDPAFDPAQEAVIAAPESVCAGLPDAAGVARAEVTDSGDAHLTLAVETDAPRLLLIRDSAYPGWEAAIDGAPTPVYRADLILRGVVIPAGSHSVTLRYAPGWLGWIGVAGALTWGLWAVGMAVLLTRRPSLPARPPVPARW